MGYYVDIIIENAYFTDEVGALKAINAMHDAEVMAKNAGGGSYEYGKAVDKWYSWVKNPNPEGFTSLEDALSAWRYESDRNRNGHLEITYFTGEKLGDDEQLLYAIAPYLNEDVIFTFRGEDGALWRYIIGEDGHLQYQEASIVWE